LWWTPPPAVLLSQRGYRNCPLIYRDGEPIDPCFAAKPCPPQPTHCITSEDCTSEFHYQGRSASNGAVYFLLNAHPTSFRGYASWADMSHRLPCWGSWAWPHHPTARPSSPVHFPKDVAPILQQHARPSSPRRSAPFPLMPYEQALPGPPA